jgi:hypothetical protein
MNQLDAIGIYHTQHRGLDHKAFNPLAMSVEQAQQTRAIVLYMALESVSIMEQRLGRS